jgi:hypothetical protein
MWYFVNRGLHAGDGDHRQNNRGLMSKLHRDLKQIPTAKPNDPIYRATKKQLNQDTVYGHDTKFPHEDPLIHNVKSGYDKRKYSRNIKIPTVIIDESGRKRVVKLSRSQYVCVEAFKKFTKRYKHCTWAILQNFTSTQTVKALVKASIFQEYTQQGKRCVKFARDDSPDLSKRVGKIQIRMVT